MFSIVLYEPEIPPNTGAIMRLAANTGCLLHLIEPLGFEMSDARLRRAGMDYRKRVVTKVHKSIDEWLAAEDPDRVFAFSPLGVQWHSTLDYAPGDALLFGPESTGLPPHVMSAIWIDDTARHPDVARRAQPQSRQRGGHRGLRSLVPPSVPGRGLSKPSSQY